MALERRKKVPALSSKKASRSGKSPRAAPERIKAVAPLKKWTSALYADDTLIVVTDGNDTALVDLTEWPPRITCLGIGALFADRAEDGALLVGGRFGARVIHDRTRTVDMPSAPHGYARGVLIGGRVVLLPATKDIAAWKNVWRPIVVDSGRTRILEELAAVEAGPIEAIRLARIGEHLIWRGDGWDWHKQRFALTWPRIANWCEPTTKIASTYAPISSVARGDGWWATIDGALVELTKNGKAVPHLNGLTCHAITAGPRETILAVIAENGMSWTGLVYRLATRTATGITSKQLPGPVAEAIAFNAATDRVVCVGRGQLVGKKSGQILRGPAHRFPLLRG